jgi:hypothetical protein
MPQRSTKKPAWTPSTIMAVLIPLLILCASLYIMLSNHYSEELVKWAYGMTGTVMGIWIRQGIKSP